MPKERDRLIDARIMRLAQETLAEAEAIADPGPRCKPKLPRRAIPSPMPYPGVGDHDL